MTRADCIKYISPLNKIEIQVRIVSVGIINASASNSYKDDDKESIKKVDLVSHLMMILSKHSLVYF